MAPGKGVHFVLTEKYLGWLRDALHDVDVVYSDEAHDQQAEIVVNTMTDPESDEISEFELTWERVKDNFGTKSFVSIPYKDGELRVTVVLSKQGELKLDIREWYDPK
jgi:hypothetical protein